LKAYESDSTSANAETLEGYNKLFKAVRDILTEPRFKLIVQDSVTSVKAGGLYCMDDVETYVEDILDDVEKGLRKKTQAKKLIKIQDVLASTESLKSDIIEYNEE